MKDIDYLIPYKVIVEVQGETSKIKLTDRYDTLAEAMAIYNSTSSFCMVTHRKPKGSKIIAYRWRN